MRVHYTADYLIDPTNPVTVHLIGAGGTGSQMLTCLARIDAALVALDHPGLQVTLWDDDIVSEANLARQLFATAEVGLSKSVVLINRINQFFGTFWKAKTSRFNTETTAGFDDYFPANLTISCVDSVASRLEIAAMLKPANTIRHGPQASFYWMDMGNSQHTGQVILSTVGQHRPRQSQTFLPVTELPFVTDEFGELLASSEVDDDTPSCSLAEALTRQDLFINSALTPLASTLLWNLFREGMIKNRGFFLNLQDFRTVPVKV